MNCACCNKELERVFPESVLAMRRRGDYPQYSDALIIDLSGGYGMYFDPLVERVERSVICKTCADDFKLANPWLVRISDNAEYFRSNGLPINDPNASWNLPK